MCFFCYKNESIIGGANVVFLFKNFVVESQPFKQRGKLTSYFSSVKKSEVGHELSVPRALEVPVSHALSSFKRQK